MTVAVGDPIQALRMSPAYAQRLSNTFFSSAVLRAAGFWRIDCSCSPMVVNKPPSVFAVT